MRLVRLWRPGVLSFQLHVCEACCADALGIGVCLRRPQVFGIRESFQDFLKDAGSKSEEVPQKLEDLAASGIRLVITDKNDPDGVGFVQWRVAFYVAGGDASLGNFMCLLDSKWRTALNKRLHRCVMIVKCSLVSRSRCV